VLVKDYNTIFLSVLLLAGLVLWKEFVIRGAAAAPTTGEVLVFVAPWMALYFTVWRLKKTQRLSAEGGEGQTA
jgi:hypothetical protein